jgi:hypothetical protein
MRACVREMRWESPDVLLELQIVSLPDIDWHECTLTEALLLSRTRVIDPLSHMINVCARHVTHAHLM